MPKLVSIFLLPPAAIARLGGGARPVDNYEWRKDPTIHGASQTIIEPATTLDVADDGSVAPFRPGVIRFRDGADLRPVAPFFELWARVQFTPAEAAASAPASVGTRPGAERDLPLTATLLRQCGGELAGVSYTLHVANRKAARRTGDEANAFEATIRVRADQHTAKPLNAFTPPRPQQEPLVLPERPIYLGKFQVLRPVRRRELDVDLDVLRVRFTPARGQVYGPPSAVDAIGTTSALPFEIVPPDNRILNPRSSWLRYDGSYATFENPEPWDTYDGADQDANVSWGVVDDTCDGILSASIVVGSRRLDAVARLFVGPPDYAPDRRPFASLADDLVDRDQDPVAANELKDASELAAVRASVADLFARVFETASLLNLDAIRRRALRDNAGWFPPGAPNTTSPPFIDQRSMTPDDAGYADDRVRALVPDAPAAELRFTPLVQLAHSPLAQEDALWAFLREQAERARRLLRPAYGAFEDLDENAQSDSAPSATHRDPRIDRDQAHDMRMPPYMRDETATALSLTRRQYVEVMRLIDALEAVKPRLDVRSAAFAAAPSAASETGEGSALRARVRNTLARARRRVASP